jgi:hypothetical protein
MSDEAQIRRANFKALAGTPKQALERLGGSYSYWRDLMEDPKKAFGEKVARRIEAAYDIPHGSLDRPGMKAASETASPAMGANGYRSLAYAEADALPQGAVRDCIHAFLERIDNIAAAKADLSKLSLAPRSNSTVRKGFRHSFQAVHHLEGNAHSVQQSEAPCLGALWRAGHCAA